MELGWKGWGWAECGRMESRAVRAGTCRQSLRNWGCLSLKKGGETLSEVGWGSGDCVGEWVFYGMGWDERSELQLQLSYMLCDLGQVTSLGLRICEEDEVGNL